MAQDDRGDGYWKIRMYGKEWTRQWGKVKTKTEQFADACETIKKKMTEQDAGTEALGGA